LQSARYPAKQIAPRSFPVIGFVASAAAGWAWNSLKNIARLLTGRKRLFDDRVPFLRQYLLHRTGLRPIRAVTCVARSGYEGAGSQAFSVIRAINFARAAGLTYVHTPFEDIYHADRPMPEWVAAWETRFNLGAGEVPCDPNRHDAVNYFYATRAIEACFGWGGPARAAELNRRVHDMVPELRAKYYRGKPRQTARDSASLTVAVHIRRGDVTPDHHLLFTPLEKFRRGIVEVRTILAARSLPFRIAVYSQGIAEDFAEVSMPGVELFLDTDALVTLEALVDADILIMSRGMFSYYAGLISNGVVISDPGVPGPFCDRFAPHPEWVVCRPDGSFDRAAFDRRLAFLLDSGPLRIY
jgi:hypothetical protein